MALTRWLLTLAALSFMAACSSPDEDALSAERQYQIIEDTHGTIAEKCAAAGKVVDAWLKRENREKYDQWKLTRDANCLAARVGVPDN